MSKSNPNQMLVLAFLLITLLGVIFSLVLYFNTQDPEISAKEYDEVSRIIHQKKNPTLNNFIRITTQDKEITQSELKEIKELSKNTKDAQTIEQVIKEIEQESLEEKDVKKPLKSHDPVVAKSI